MGTNHSYLIAPATNGQAPNCQSQTLAPQDRRPPIFQSNQITVMGCLALAYARDRGTTHGANSTGGWAAVLHGNRLGVLDLSFFSALHAVCIHNFPPKANYLCTEITTRIAIRQ